MISKQPIHSLLQKTPLTASGSAANVRHRDVAPYRLLTGWSLMPAGDHFQLPPIVTSSAADLLKSPRIEHRQNL
jgi:hypothetical protein